MFPTIHHKATFVFQDLSGSYDKEYLFLAALSHDKQPYVFLAYRPKVKNSLGSDDSLLAAALIASQMCGIVATMENNYHQSETGISDKHVTRI